MSNAPNFLNWNVAVAAGQTAALTNFAFANNGGPGDTISDTLGTAAAITALNAAMDTHVVAVGDRLLLGAQTASWQNGVYIASSVASVFGRVATLGAITQPTGTLTNGIYRNVATTSSGSGTGAQVDVTVSGGVVVSVALSQAYGDAPGQGGPISGSGYAVGDTVAFTGTGLGTGGHSVVASLCPSFVLTRAESANSAEQLAGLSVFVSGGATLAGQAFVQTNGALTLDVVSQISGTGAIVQPTATMYSPIVNGTYAGVPLAGGHGSGAAGTVTVSGGAVTAVTVTSLGAGYQNGDVLTFAGMSGSGVSTDVNTWGIGTGGTVVVNTALPASSAVTFVQLVA